MKFCSRTQILVLQQHLEFGGRGWNRQCEILYSFARVYPIDTGAVVKVVVFVRVGFEVAAGRTVVAGVTGGAAGENRGQKGGLEVAKAGFRHRGDTNNSGNTALRTGIVRRNDIGIDGEATTAGGNGGRR